MCTECGIISLGSYNVDLEKMISQFSDKADEESDTFLKRIQQKFIEIPKTFFYDPSSVTQIQDQMSGLISLFLNKIQNYPNSAAILQEIDQSLVPLSRVQFLQFPIELTLETFLHLPMKDLLTMRLVCQHYRKFIDSQPELQARIAFHFLQNMLPKWNISIDDLKINLTNNKLTVEVNNNLTLFKLIAKSPSSYPLLKKALPCITHLIIKNGKPNELKELFEELLQSQQLTSLTLIDCEVDSKASEFLQLLVSSDLQDRRKLTVLYLCNLKPSNYQLPQYFSDSSSKIVFINPDKAGEYSFEGFLTTEADLIALKELEQKVQIESSSSEIVLKKLKALTPSIKDAIISSIWHSTLMPASADLQKISKKLINREVYAFVSESPHHSSIIAAISKILKLFPN